MNPSIDYLRDGTLPRDPKEVSQIRRRSKQFLRYEGILYERAFAQPLLRCTTLEDGHKILEEIHKG